jgi:hypothetical protein
MRRYFCLYVALALTFTDLATAIAEESGRWELEERRNFIFTLSHKQSASINDQIATSLPFCAIKKNRSGVIGAILVPFDGTFETHQDPIPMSIQRRSDEIGPSDLFQKWKNGSEFLSSDVPEDFADLIALLKEKDTDSDESVHFYFPSGLDNDQQTSDDIVVDASGFATKFEEFESDCTSR